MGVQSRIRQGLTHAKVPSGALPTNFPIAPTVQFHPNTAKMTMLGGTATITANLSTGTPNLTVTAITGSPIAIGMEIYGDPALNDQPFRILSQTSGTTGGTGVYVMQDQAGANRTGTTLTCTGLRVITSITDKSGLYQLVPVVDGLGPILETAADGVKEVSNTRRTGQIGPGYPMKCTGLTSIDNHQMTWFAVMKAPTTMPGCLISLGTVGASPPKQQAIAYGSPGMTFSVSALTSLRNYFFNDPAGIVVTGAAKNKMIVHAGLQVVGVSYSAPTDIGNASGSNCYVRLYHNENTSFISNTGMLARTVGIAGFSVGHLAGGTASTEASCIARWREIIGYTQDELAPSHNTSTRVAETAANADAARDVLLYNHAIVPLTRGILITGDSRTGHDEASGVTVASAMAERGSPTAIPENVRVIVSAHPGLGTQSMYKAMMNPYGPFDTSCMFGSGNDHCIGLWGANDGSDQSISLQSWPNTNTIGGTTARADEIFDNQGGTTTLNATFTGSISKSATLLTAATPTGTIQPGSILNYSGSPSPALEVGNTSPANSWTGNGAGDYKLVLTSANITIPADVASGTAMTSVWSTRVNNVQTILSRGFHYTQIIEPMYSGGFGIGADVLRGHDLNDLAGKVTPNSGRNFGTWDPRQIKVGPLFVFGVDWVASSTYYIDNIHWTQTGSKTMASGGDTPSKGLAAAAMRLWA